MADGAGGSAHTVASVAAAVGCAFTGDGGVVVRAVRSLESAGEGDISFAMDARHARRVSSSRASAFVLPAEVAYDEKPVIRSRNPYYVFSQVLKLFYSEPLPLGPHVHPSAVLEEGVRMGADCYIGANVVVGRDATLGDRVRVLANSTIYPGAVLGDDVLVHSNAVIREFCVLGKRVVIQNGAVIGGDGFGFAKDDQGRYQKIVQAGRVVLEDDVEVQANTCIDRGTLEDTVIRSGAKLDNLIQVGHGCTVGEDTVMAAQVGLAGSTIVGRRVMVGGQSGIAGHCTVGDGAVIQAGSGVAGNVGPGDTVWGWLATDHKVYRRAVLAFPRLPEWVDRVRKLEKEMESWKASHE